MWVIKVQGRLTLHRLTTSAEPPYKTSRSVADRNSVCGPLFGWKITFCASSVSIGSGFGCACTLVSCRILWFRFFSAFSKGFFKIFGQGSVGLKLLSYAFVQVLLSSSNLHVICSVQTVHQPVRYIPVAVLF